MKYIGANIVHATPMIRVSGFGIPWESGYAVDLPDGNQCFYTKEVFEKSYLPLSTNKDMKTAAPSVSQKMVDDFIAETEVITMGDKTTVVRATLRNGFTIVESSSCVSPENYDEKMGADICLEHIKDKIWMLLGFLLQTAVGGVEV